MVGAVKVIQCPAMPGAMGTQSIAPGKRTNDLKHFLMQPTGRSSALFPFRVSLERAGYRDPVITHYGALALDKPLSQEALRRVLTCFPPAVIQGPFLLLSANGEQLLTLILRHQQFLKMTL